MPIWAEKGDVLKRSTKILIKQYTKHFPNERTISLTGKYGEQQSIDLKGADLDTDLNYEVVKNSEIPTGPYQTRKNLNDMLMLTGGIEGYVMLVEQKPQMAAKIEQAFDVDLETDEFDDVAELCRKRLNQMKAALESGVNDPLALVGAMLDPMSGQMIPAPNGGAIQPPISPAEPNLKRKAQWFSDVLDTDEMQKAPMELRRHVRCWRRGKSCTTRRSSPRLHNLRVKSNWQASSREWRLNRPCSRRSNPTSPLNYRHSNSKPMHSNKRHRASNKWCSRLVML
jgi:hypothetical protein